MLTRKIGLIDPDIRRYVVLRCYRIILKATSESFDPNIRDTFQNSIKFQFRSNLGLLSNYSQPIRKAEQLAEICLDACDFSNEATRKKGLKELVKFGYGFKVLDSGDGKSKVNKLLNIKAVHKLKAKDFSPDVRTAILGEAEKTGDPLIARVYRSLFSPSSDK